MDKRIYIHKDSLRLEAARRNLVANICAALNAYLSDNTPIQIEIRSDVSLNDASDILRKVADIIDSTASIVDPPKAKSDDDRDEADWWKEDYE